MAKDDGGPAFPGKRVKHNSVHYDEDQGRNVFDTEDVSGMSLRDWFAGQACLGLVTGSYFQTTKEDLTALQLHEGAQEVSAFAYKIADAMLKERQQ
jgi:hypothetical protein